MLYFVHSTGIDGGLTNRNCIAGMEQWSGTTVRASCMSESRGLRINNPAVANYTAVQGTHALAKWVSIRINTYSQLKPNGTIMEFTSRIKEQFGHLSLKRHCYYNFVIYVFVATFWTVSRNNNSSGLSEVRQPFGLFAYICDIK